MLIQYKSISSLDADAKKRLKQAASGLLQTNEAAKGYVTFEGHYFAINEIRDLTGTKKQILNE